MGSVCYVNAGQQPCKTSNHNISGLYKKATILQHFFFLSSKKIQPLQFLQRMCFYTFLVPVQWQCVHRVCGFLAENFPRGLGLRFVVLYLLSAAALASWLLSCGKETNAFVVTSSIAMVAVFDARFVSNSTPLKTAAMVFEAAFLKLICFLGRFLNPNGKSVMECTSRVTMGNGFIIY